MKLDAKFLPTKRWWDVWIAIFATGAIISVAGRIWITEWINFLYILVYLAFIAALTGLALGYSQFSPLFAGLFSLLYGTFTIGWLLGTTVNADIAWRERILNYIGWRLRIAIEQFSAGQTVSDSILFLTIMAILLWIMATTTTFILIRQGAVWPVLIPLGITLLTISHFDQNLPRNAGFLMTFIFSVLIIVGRMNILHSRENWRQEGLPTPPENLRYLTKVMLSFTFLMIVISGVLPITSTQVNQYSQWWRNATQPLDRLKNNFARILVVDQVTQTTISPIFAQSMGLGNGIPESEAVVFTVEVNLAPESDNRNYWRTRSYDLYQGAVWSSSAGLKTTLQFPESFEVKYPQWEGDQLASYIFSIQSSQMLNLYATGTPVRISRPVETITLPLSNSEEDLIALIADPALYFGESYQIDTLVRMPTATDLRRTGTDYPAWLDRYLQLPDDLSPKIADLAIEITSEEKHPYDMAVAITRYLRNTIEYARIIPAIPRGADPIEWFLFDGQIGFCNYYATAQVLMLRSLGIPARISVGYAEGEFDPDSQTYTIRRQDSHAWPEVYFVNYGWVPFEPTTSQLIYMLPEGVNQVTQDNDLSGREIPSPIDGDLDALLAQIEQMERDGMAADPGVPTSNDLSGLPAQDEDIATDARGRLHSLTDQIANLFSGSRGQWIFTILFLITAALLAINLNRIYQAVISIDPIPVILERLLEKHGLTVPNWLRKWSHTASMSPIEKAYRHLGQAIKILGEQLNRTQTPSERGQTLLALLPNAEQPIKDIIADYQLYKFSTHPISKPNSSHSGRSVRKMALHSRLQRLLPR